MYERKTSVRFLCLPVCMLVLIGCDRSAKKRDKVVTEAAEVKTELENVRAELEKTKRERDKIKESVAEYTGALEDAKLKLTNMMQIQEDLEQKVVVLKKQRDTAVVKMQDTQAMITTLRSQLGEKTMEIQKLTQWNSEWQAVVQELQSQIEQETQPAVEQAIEEPNEVLEEQLQEEIINEDNV